MFQRLKQEDERSAPSFADSWDAARSRLETRGQSVRAPSSNWLRWSLAAVAAILVIFGFIVYRVVQNEPRKNRGVITENESQKADGVITKKATTPKLSVEHEKQIVKENLGTRPARSAPQIVRSAPRPRRRDWLQINEPIITDTETVYAKRGEYASDFIPLTYGGVQNPMDSGEVIRMQMPRSALIAFGLPVNVEHADAPVKAELLLGEDGMARAIRFVR